MHSAKQRASREYDRVVSQFTTVNGSLLLVAIPSKPTTKTFFFFFFFFFFFRRVGTQEVLSYIVQQLWLWCYIELWIYNLP